MSKTIRFISLPLLLTVILALFSFYGCSGAITQPGEATTAPPGATNEAELNSQQLEQILADSLTNYENLNTYRFNMDMDISTSIEGGPSSGEIKMNTQASGAVDIASDQMQMNASMSMEGLPQEQGGMQDIAFEIYLMSDWIYMKFDVTEMGDQWIKMPVTEKLLQELNLDIVNQQIQPLDSPVKIEYLRSESVDGIDCYVLALTPNMEKLGQWLNEQQGPGQGLDWEEMANNPDIFKKIEYTCYIAKESSHLVRLTCNMVIEYTGEQVGISEGAPDKMTMEISADMKLYDHNVPFSITLPDEAANAMEVSEDIFLQE